MNNGVWYDPSTWNKGTRDTVVTAVKIITGIILAILEDKSAKESPAPAIEK